MCAIVERIGCNPRELLHNPIIHGTIWQVPNIFGGYYRATHVGMSATRRPIVWDDSREKKGVPMLAGRETSQKLSIEYRGYALDGRNPVDMPP